MPPVNFERLRDRRDELDLSNEALAEQMGLSQGYAENILYGTDEPSMRVIYRFSRVLDLPVKEIVVADPDPDPNPASEPEPAQPAREKDPAGPPARRNGRDDRRGPRRVTQAGVA